MLLGIHSCYEAGRPDSLLEVSTFVSPALEYRSFSRHQGSNVHYVIRALTPQPLPDSPRCDESSAGSARMDLSDGCNAEVANNSGPQTTSGSEPTVARSIVDTAEDKAADGDAKATAPIADLDADTANDQLSLAASDTAAERQQGKAPSSPSLKGSREVTCSRWNTAAGQPVVQPFKPSLRPFQLEFHPGARPDGLMSHHQRGNSSTCTYKGRHDNLSRRNVMFTRWEACAGAGWL